MSQDRVMLLIDADNVSVDVMEQAVARLLDEYGALHVRRAYCTAESAVKHQAVFKRLSIKPMVNLAAGKNSTDIALAVDAVDLVLAERPEVVVIASSDSDFAPLVSRLREKGCKVRGFGQEGKTGDETRSVYDSFDVLVHRSSTATPAARSVARGVARKTPRRRTAAVPPEADAQTQPPVKAPVRRAAAKKVAAAESTEASAPRPRRTRAAKSSTQAAAQAATPVSPAAAVDVAAEAVEAPPQAMAPAAVAELLRSLPALAAGETLELQKAAEQLRRAGLLSRSSSAQKMFGRFPDWFDLQPAANPKRVRLRQ